MDEESIFQFIERVRSEDLLWYEYGKSRHLNRMRVKLWDAIGGEFNMDGEDARIVFGKLREKYIREYQKQSKTKPSKWIYFKSLEFLDEDFVRHKYKNDQKKGGILKSVGSKDSSDSDESSKHSGSSSQFSSTPIVCQIGVANMEKVIEAIELEQQGEHEDVLGFIRGTLNSLPTADALAFEKELSMLTMLYRYELKSNSMENKKIP